MRPLTNLSKIGIAFGSLAIAAMAVVLTYRTGYTSGYDQHCAETIVISGIIAEKISSKGPEVPMASLTRVFDVLYLGNLGYLEQQQKKWWRKPFSSGQLSEEPMRKAIVRLNKFAEWRRRARHE